MRPLDAGGPRHSSRICGSTNSVRSGCWMIPLSADLRRKSPAWQCMNRAAFDIYIETQLAPTLQPGDVVIADNLSSHKSAHAQELLKSQGSWLLFLPPYT